jgi:hypothetical protein
MTTNIRHFVGAFLLSFVVFFFFFCPPRRFVDNHAGKRLIALLQAEGPGADFVWERVYVGHLHHLQNYVQFRLRIWLKSLGVWDVSIVNSLVCALAAALFAAFVWLWLCQYMLSRWERVGLWLFVLFGAPGIVLIYRHTEDNVTFYPFIFVFFLLISRWNPNPRPWERFPQATQYLLWLLAGLFWGLAWHWNSTTIVYGVLVLLLPFHLFRKRPDRSLPFLLALPVAILVYMAIHYSYFAVYPNEDTVLHSLQLVLKLDQGMSDIYTRELNRFSWLYVEKCWTGLKTLLLFYFHKHSPLRWLNGLLALVLWTGTLLWFVERMWKGENFLARRSGLSSYRVLLLLGIALTLAILFESNALERWDMAFFTFAILWIMGYLSETRPRVKRWLWVFVIFQLWQAGWMYADAPYREYFSYAIEIKNFNDRAYRALINRLYAQARRHKRPHQIRVVIMPYRLFVADLSLRLAWQSAWDDIYFARKDLVKGRKVWRFYTCPNPQDPCSPAHFPHNLHVKKYRFFPNQRMLRKTELWGVFENRTDTNPGNFHFTPIPLSKMRTYVRTYSRDSVLVHKELKHLFTPQKLLELARKKLIDPCLLNHSKTKRPTAKKVSYRSKKTLSSKTSINQKALLQPKASKKATLRRKVPPVSRPTIPKAATPTTRPVPTLRPTTKTTAQPTSRPTSRPSTQPAK